MKLNKLAMTMLAGCAIALIGCGGDSGTAATGDSSGYYCKVTRGANSVSVDNSYKGASYTSTATITSDTQISFHSIFGYPTQAMADEACAAQKDEESYWQDGSYKVSCSGRNVTVDDYSEYFSVGPDTLEEVALEFEEMCQEGQDRVDRGEVDF
ncbi:MULTISPECIES: hypothetical protein [unclassified Fibrobacter]|uniref:hypothetical protein n=1 Tax=unclassified Fibrobacter TaxID=2634177 RepID=UPI000D6AD31E|nr:MULTISPECIES: hypothetical protein [unclassified Fibrobacter]PWJ63695.1 hypothetical protein BGX12_11711 [Fibrobacter sp. UWR4]PZW69083.1 hypothetical protein C8E88_101612 [Fibrobacter sp. UWR1]